MKNTLWLATLVLLMWTGCRQKAPKTQDQTKQNSDALIDYQIEKYYRKYHLFDDSSKPTCSVQLSLPRLTNGFSPEQLKFARETLYSKFFTADSTAVLLKERFQAEAEAYINKYKQLEKNIKPEQDLDYSYNWTFDNNAELYHESAKYLTYRIHRFSNVGGSFPEMRTEYLCLDLPKQRIITRDVVFVANKQKQFKELIYNRLRSDYDTEEEMKANIWVENLSISANIYITDSLLNLYYNPGEIGPQSAGPIELSFTLSDIGDYLNPEITK